MPRFRNKFGMTPYRTPTKPIQEPANLSQAKPRTKNPHFTRATPQRRTPRSTESCVRLLRQSQSKNSQISASKKPERNIPIPHAQPNKGALPAPRGAACACSDKTNLRTRKSPQAKPRTKNPHFTRATPQRRTPRSAGSCVRLLRQSQSKKLSNLRKQKTRTKHPHSTRATPQRRTPRSAGSCVRLCRKSQSKNSQISAIKTQNKKIIFPRAQPNKGALPAPRGAACACSDKANLRTRKGLQAPIATIS